MVENIKERKLEIMDMLIEGRISKEEALDLLNLTDTLEATFDDSNKSQDKIEESAQKIANEMMNQFDIESILNFCHEQEITFNGYDYTEELIKELLTDLVYNCITEIVIDGNEDEFTIDSHGFEVQSWVANWGDDKETIEFSCRFIMSQADVSIDYKTLKLDE